MNADNFRGSENNSVSRSVVSNSCNAMDCIPPDSSVYGISQARTLERVAIPFSRDLPNPGIEPVSITGRFFTLSYQGALVVEER